MRSICPRLIVLLAEDDENDILFVRRALEKLGLVERLITVRDGAQVLAYFRALESGAIDPDHPAPDLLILDQNMPQVSGLDLLFWLRTQKRFESLPAMVLTTGLPPDRYKMLRRLGAVF